MFVTHLECTLCSAHYDQTRLQTLCESCHRPLYARYDLDRVKTALPRAALATRESSLWRYREALPLPVGVAPVTLGEGWTPLLETPRLAAALGMDRTWIKDESQNPTSSFKARGMAVAVSMAKHLGATALAAPSAGNAGGAMAAYAARAGLSAHVFMPKDTPKANIIECREMGAHVTLIDGLIHDCGAEVAKRKAAEGWFDMSTLKEPYRAEGKKTLGYELAEQLGWTLPDLIIYPTGGGTGLVGMWKAFDEMERMGWIGSGRPRMIAVQADGCQPIVKAFLAHERFAPLYENARTSASGLRVPKAVGDFLIIDAVVASGGEAIAVSDAQMIAETRVTGSLEGLFVAPEGGACVAALRALRQAGRVQADESAVIFNTGAGVKYLECYGG